MATVSSLRHKLKHEEWEISGKIKTLVTLHLVGYFRQLPDELYGLKELEALNIVRNNEINIPNELAKLTNLKVLSLQNCGLTTVPAAVMKLPQLEMLILSRNKNITLPDDMSGLINLTVLDLKHCNLDTLPPEVLKQPNLQVLDLRDNMQISLPYDLYRLNNLKVLKLGGCNLDTVPPAVVRLNLLEELDLGGNRGIHLPDGLARLTNLRVLKLATTNMDTVPPVVWRLTQLERLDLSGNQLQTLPAEIGQLINAKHLDLSRCKLRKLPPEVGRLTQLKRLNLSGNKLQTLPAEVGQLSSACHLDVIGNPLTKPPSEVCRYGIAAISQYFDELERSEEKKSAHMKVVVLGEKMAGKTSLVQTLDSGKSTLTEEEDRTHCVEITQWAPKDNITFEVYDFGGHDVYHLTHQFFLTPDAFYLLLVNLQTYSCSEERYTEAVGFWLDTLKARVPGAVVSIVGSKKDLCLPDEVKAKTKHVQERIRLQIDMWEKEEIRAIDIGQHNLRTKYLSKPGLRIVGEALDLCVSVKPKFLFVELLSKSSRSWVKLKDVLLETANNKKLFPTLKWILPRTWVEFEQLVRRQASTETSEQADKAGSSVERSPQQESQQPTQHWLTMTDCKRLGQLAGLSSERLEPVLSYLQQVGTILRYTDIPELKDYVFHDPPALIELFKDLFHHDTSALFSTPRLSQFTSSQLSTFQSDLCDCGLIQKEVMACLLPPNVSPDIITALIQHFGLCFEVEAKDNTDASKHSRQYKIPWYIHKQMPKELMRIWPDDVPEDQEQLQLMCNIRGFCPRGLFQRFSVGIHPLVEDRVDWKDGVMAYRQDCIVLVSSKPIADDTYITMATRGRLAQADEMWGVVHPLLEMLVQLLQEWPGVLYSLHVTCAHCIKAGLEEPWQFELRDRTAEDDSDVRCRKVRKRTLTSADLVYRPARFSAVGRGSSPTGVKPSQQENDCYKMTSDPRGVALIISNTDFTGPKRNRLGGAKDLERLRKICGKLKLQPEIKQNLTAQEIEAVTKDFSRRDHSSYDCFVLFLLSHGSETGVSGTDGQHVSVDSIISSFQSCKSLVGKPKLFFIQACRGVERDKGLEQTDSATDEASSTSQTGTEASNRTTEATASPPLSTITWATPVESPDAGETLPTASDRLVMYATVHGHVSWRNSNKGTWLVEALADIITEHADTEELHDMLRRVNAKVADYKIRKRNQEYKQQPEVTHTLRKRLYFFPSSLPESSDQHQDHNASGNRPEELESGEVAGASADCAAQQQSSE